MLTIYAGPESLQTWDILYINDRSSAYASRPKISKSYYFSRLPRDYGLGNMKHHNYICYGHYNTSLNLHMNIDKLKIKISENLKVRLLKNKIVLEKIT